MVLLLNPNGRNEKKLACPKCSCVVLAANSAPLKSLAQDSKDPKAPVTLINSIELDSSSPPSSPSFSSVALKLPTFDGKDLDDNAFWMVKDSFDFYNIGVSVPIDSDIVAEIKKVLGVEHVRFLACADCGIAPLGITYSSKEEDSEIYLVQKDRVIVVSPPRAQ